MKQVLVLAPGHISKFTDQTNYSTMGIYKNKRNFETVAYFLNNRKVVLTTHVCQIEEY